MNPRPRYESSSLLQVGIQVHPRKPSISLKFQNYALLSKLAHVLLFNPRLNVLLSITYYIQKLPASPRIYREQLIPHPIFSAFPHPLEQQEILKLIGVEYLQYLERFVITEILKEIAYVLRDDANVTNHIIRRARIPLCRKYFHARLSVDQERLFAAFGCYAFPAELQALHRGEQQSWSWRCESLSGW